MPTTRRSYARSKKRYAPRRRIYATKKKFMPTQLAKERYGGVSTKTFYFKGAGSVNADVIGNTLRPWVTQLIPGAPGQPVRIIEVADSVKVSTCYTEYKVLSLKLRLFAANIGTEPGMEVLGPDIPGFNRGDAVIYIDQDVNRSEVYPPNILQVINKGSARMIAPRAQKHTVTMYRKKGVPGWGCCDPNIALLDRAPDPWLAAIVLTGNNARVGIPVRPLWYFTITYKILFRGRNYQT